MTRRNMRPRCQLRACSERQLQAWWHYAPSARHAVSAAVAACSVKRGGGGGVGLLTYLYSHPLPRKRNAV